MFIKFSKFLKANQNTKTTQTIASTQSTSTAVSAIEPSKYGEDCDLLKNKTCRVNDGLECSIDLKCGCKKDWYYNNSLCGLYLLQFKNGFIINLSKIGEILIEKT